MNYKSEHRFHIPVMGLGYTIDTPVKVARYGISSVISIMEDNLIEDMRAYYCKKHGHEYIAIHKSDHDYRAKRITAYLNLLKDIVDHDFQIIKNSSFGSNTELSKYFELLPDSSPLKIMFNEMNRINDPVVIKYLENVLKGKMKAGAIDVNIMTKCDKPNYSDSGELLPAEYSDAMAALRGYANSNLESSLIFSAGMNPRLYTYCESFPDFYPDRNGHIKKKIVLKVSDYRSAHIQGKFLAKKGLWVSEFRIESGLNCGGHAFATEGLLMGPILEEFKKNRSALHAELYTICTEEISKKTGNAFNLPLSLKITAQGGIGTANENDFLLSYYKLDGTGWGSPFLLVPEATNVDDETLSRLIHAKKEDYYLSHASPLGVPFNNFRNSSSDILRKERIVKGRPGSPCYKKFLSFNSEFTDKPVCVASRRYQQLKISQLQNAGLSKQEYEKEFNKIVEKECLCEGLSSSAKIVNGMPARHNLSAVSICPGPNLAYFSKVSTLREMVDHIYGRISLLNLAERQNMFVNELQLYANYLKDELDKVKYAIEQKQEKYFTTFKENLMKGISYYKGIIPQMAQESEKYKKQMEDALSAIYESISHIEIPGRMSAV